MNWTLTLRRLLLIGLAVAGAGPLVADDPTPTPTPTPSATPTAAAVSGTLSDVAGGIKLNPAATGPDGNVVISDQNLGELAGKGRITEVTKSGPQANRRQLADVQGGEGAGIEGETPGHQDELEKKQHWQAVYGRQIDLLNDIAKQIEILDLEIPGLWRDFYAWDDPAYRDGVIKPRLDDALARREKLEGELQNGQAELDRIKDQARRDGAEPGWFRGFPPPPAPKPTTGAMPL